MFVKLNTISKAVCFSLLALFLFASCEEPTTPADNGDGVDHYSNPNSGNTRYVTFSHNSGLYPAQFSLTITGPVGSTIYYSTDGSEPTSAKVGNGHVFQYTAPITVRDRNNPMQANVLASTTNHEQMYMVPNDPRGDVPQIYTGLTNDKVPKATIIRAAAFVGGSQNGDIVTRTYFIGSLPSAYANTRIISLVSDPVGLVSEETGIMVRGSSSNLWNGTDQYNFRQKGEEWERPAYLEIFDENSRGLRLSTGVGIRVRGGYSRGTGQKSFTVYFKNQYGINNLSRGTYDLIPGAKKADGNRVDTFKGFMLRSGANDSEYTKFYDLFIQELLNDRSFATQEGDPCIVYLNGEYWGPYNLQERYSDNHTGYKYGVKNENVISYDNDELDDGNPGEESLYLNLINGVINGSINYNQFCAQFDIDNFIDYWAAEVYINNEDWPQNNYRVWKVRNPALEAANNPYGDGKWRYQMFDTEFALGLYSNSIRDPIDVILNGKYSENGSDPHLNNKLFKKLLEYPDFCKQFVNTIMDLYNVNFHPSKFESLLTKYATRFAPLMGYDETTPGTYFSRWGRPWDSAYQDNVNEARNYLYDIRPAMVNDYLPTHFGSYTGTAHDVTITVTGRSELIKVNTVTVVSGWTGKYYSNNPITVTAPSPTNGYELEWTVTGGTPTTSTASSITVTITGDAQITAKYKLTSTPAVPVTGITLNNTTLTLNTGGTSNLTATVSPPGATDKTVYWHSSNPLVASVTSTGISTGRVTALSTGSASSGTATITASTAEGIHTATCTVTVNPIVQSVNLDLNTLKLFTGDSVKLTATVLPDNSPNKNVTWSSSDQTKATVTNNGTITGVSAGSATITVTTVDGVRTAQCTVNVKAPTQAIVLLDLAERLDTLDESTGDMDWDDWYSAFGDGHADGSIKINPAGNYVEHTNDEGYHPVQVSFKIIKNVVTNELQVSDFVDYASGLSITTRPLQAGDRIEIEGRFLNGPNDSASGGLLANTGCGYLIDENDTSDDPARQWWRPLGGWNPSFSAKGTSFSRTFVLSVEDAEKMNSNPWGDAFKIRMNGLNQGDNGSIIPTGIGSFSIRQIKVYRPAD